jgi:hypothetical protein
MGEILISKNLFDPRPHLLFFLGFAQKSIKIRE